MNFTPSKDINEELVMHSKNDNIEVLLIINQVKFSKNFENWIIGSSCRYMLLLPAQY